MSQKVTRALRTGLIAGLAALVLGLFASDRAPADTARLVGAGEDETFNPLCVTLDVLNVDGAFRWERETTGLLLALLEGGLAVLDDTTVRVGSAPPPPGRPTCARDEERWRAILEVAASDDALQAAVWLCEGDDRCRVLGAQAPLDAPESVARALLSQIAEVLDRDPALALGWAVGQSRDPYAELLAGRAAAVFYGLLPAPDPTRVGRGVRDPLVHAVLVDPRMPVAAWMLARRELGGERGERMPAVLDRANPAGVDPVDLALAEAQARHGQPSAALALWDAIQRALPQDRRVTLERVDALIRADRLTDARAALDGMPDDMLDLPRFLELSVAWQEAADQPLHPDGLLALWQMRAPGDPRPVHKRIEAMVRDHRYADGLELTPELEERGLPVAARRLRLALANELGEAAVAAEAAVALEDPDLASVLRGEAVAPTGRPELREAEEAVALEDARQALASDAPAEAIAHLRALLATNPWDPDALALEAIAFAAMGDSLAARRARCRLRQVDPAHDGASPTSAAALTVARQCEDLP